LCFCTIGRICNRCTGCLAMAKLWKCIRPTEPRVSGNPPGPPDALRMPANIAGDKIDAPIACAVPIHFVHTAGCCNANAKCYRVDACTRFMPIVTFSSRAQRAIVTAGRGCSMLLSEEKKEKKNKYYALLLELTELFSASTGRPTCDVTAAFWRNIFCIQW